MHTHGDCKHRVNGRSSESARWKHQSRNLQFFIDGTLKLDCFQTHREETADIIADNELLLFLPTNQSVATPHLIECMCPPPPTTPLLISLGPLYKRRPPLHSSPRRLVNITIQGFKDTPTHSAGLLLCLGHILFQCGAHVTPRVCTVCVAGGGLATLL